MYRITEGPSRSLGPNRKPRSRSCFAVCLLLTLVLVQTLQIAQWRRGTGGSHGVVLLRGDLPGWVESLKESDRSVLKQLLTEGRLNSADLSYMNKDYLRRILPRPLVVNRIWNAYLKANNAKPVGGLTGEMDEMAQLYKKLGNMPTLTPGEKGSRRNKMVNIEENAEEANGAGPRDDDAARRDSREEAEARAEAEKWKKINAIRKQQQIEFEDEIRKEGKEMIIPEDGFFREPGFNAEFVGDPDRMQEALQRETKNPAYNLTGNIYEDRYRKIGMENPNRGRNIREDIMNNFHEGGPPESEMLGDLDNYEAKTGKFKCSWPDCGKQFTEVRQFIDHTTRHGLEDENDPDNCKKRMFGEGRDGITATWLKEAGNHRFREKKYEEAERLYSKAIWEDPSQHVFFVNRANARFRLGNYTGSLDDAKEAIRLCRTFGKGHYRLGEACMKLGYYKVAAEAYMKGAVCPDNEDCREAWREKARIATRKAEKAAHEERKEEVYRRRQSRPFEETDDDGKPAIQDFVTFKPPDSDYYDEEEDKHPGREQQQTLGIPEKQRKIDPIESQHQFVEKSLEAHRKMTALQNVMGQMMEANGENELDQDDENPKYRGTHRSFFSRALEKLRKHETGG